MNADGDYLMLCRLAVPGLLMVGLGLAGLLLQRSPAALARAGAVCGCGCLLVFEGAFLLHRTTTPITLRGGLLLVITAAAGFAWRVSRTEASRRQFS